MARTRIEGTNGNDRLEEAFNGASDIFGFGGNDEIVLSRSDDLGGDNFVDAGAGNDVVVNRFEGGNVVLLGAGNDAYAADGFTSFGFDQVDGGDGADRFVVATFQSAYSGGAGADTFISAGWRNVFDGGAGVDTLSYADRHLDPTQGDSAVNVDLAAGKAFTGAARFETVRNVENVKGTIHADEIFGDRLNNRLEGGAGDDLVVGDAGNDIVLGGAGADRITGETGNDLVDGGAGDDLVLGEAGNDRVFGGTGDDRLDGGAGNDLVFGGFGQDVQSGGAGVDRFIFKAVDESRPGAIRDEILDFARAQRDRIDLAAIDADAGAAGNQAFRFIGGAAFSDDAGELRFRGGLLSGDVTGDGRADFEIEIAAALRAGDFLL